MPLHTAADGCRIHYTDDGAGVPVLLIPGLGGNGAFFAPVARQLAATFRVLTMDHRGAGRSDRPAGEYSIPLIAADAVGVLDAAGIAQAHVVGHSTGGMIVQTMALDHGPRIASLVISGSWAAPDERFRRLFAARLSLLLSGDVVAYQKLTQALGYPGDWIERNRSRLDDELMAAGERLAPLAVHAARIRMLLDYTRRDELVAIRAPALVIGADDDALVPFEHAQRLAAAIPRARLEKVRGGHFFPAVVPEQVAALLGAFLREAW